MAQISERQFAVVTGGSNGIGFELARQLTQNGFDVMIAAEDTDNLKLAAERLSVKGVPALVRRSTAQ
jgi:short-subunit dehydrogenase